MNIQGIGASIQRVYMPTLGPSRTTLKDELEEEQNRTEKKKNKKKRGTGNFKNETSLLNRVGNKVNLCCSGLNGKPEYTWVTLFTQNMLRQTRQ